MNHMPFTGGPQLTTEPAAHSSAVLGGGRFGALRAQPRPANEIRTSRPQTFGDEKRRNAVTDIAPEELDAIHQRVRQTSLTKEQVFRLWKCAIKDDDGLIDEMIQQIYEHIIAFDCQRAEYVIELIVRRNASAICAFRALLRDMRLVDSPVGLLDRPPTPQNS
jgi:hypothetical protein